MYLLLRNDYFIEKITPEISFRWKGKEFLFKTLTKTLDQTVFVKFDS